jgi:hypothetical protein
MIMKVSIITLATVLVLSSPFAMAQSSSNSYMSPAFRSSMNSIPATHHRTSARNTETKRFNGYGISRLGVTTNQGRLYNGG